jgi:hypothetical protein
MGVVSGTEADSTGAHLLPVVDRTRWLLIGGRRHSRHPPQIFPEWPNLAEDLKGIHQAALDFLRLGYAEGYKYFLNHK